MEFTKTAHDVESSRLLAPLAMMHGGLGDEKRENSLVGLYAYEVIANDWLDVDQCTLSPIDLGGFWNTLNNNADQDEITIGMGYTLEDSPARNKAQTEFGKLSIEALETYEYLPGCTAISPNGDAGPNWGYVEFTVASF